MEIRRIALLPHYFTHDENSARVDKAMYQRIAHASAMRHGSFDYAI